MHRVTIDLRKIVAAHAAARMVGTGSVPTLFANWTRPGAGGTKYHSAPGGTPIENPGPVKRCAGSWTRVSAGPAHPAAIREPSPAIPARTASRNIERRFEVVMGASLSMAIAHSPARSAGRMCASRSDSGS